MGNAANLHIDFGKFLDPDTPDQHTSPTMYVIDNKRTRPTDLFSKAWDCASRTTRPRQSIQLNHTTETKRAVGSEEARLHNET